MIKLYIGNTEVTETGATTYNSADLHSDESITLTTQINDFESISGQRAPYTKQFLIPCTNRNNNLLQQYSQVDISSSLNPHKTLKAKLLIGELMEINGGIEIKGYSWMDGKPEDYKIVFYGTEFSIKALLNKQLNEIDWSDYDYELTYANMKLSWAGTLNSGNVLLPVMSHVRDYLYQPNFTGQNNPNNIGNNAPYYAEDDEQLENPILPGIRLDELKTALLLPAMIETIYGDIGVSVTWGANIAAYLAGVFVIPSVDSGMAKNETATQDLDTLVVKSDEVAYQTLALGTYTTLDMPTEIQDEANLWNNTTDTFTAPRSGVYRFELGFGVVDATTCDKTTKDRNVMFRAYKNGTTTFDETDWIPCFIIGGRVYFEGYLATSDTLVFQGKTDPLRAAGVGFKFFKLVMLSSPTALYGQTTAITDNMPEMTAYEFISGFLKTYNLLQVIELSDAGGDIDITSVKIIDKDEYYRNGTARDWTRFISKGERNYDKPEIDKDLILKYADYEDKVNNAFFKDALRNFGQLNYKSEADYHGKDLDVDSIFTIFPPSYLDWLDVSGNPAFPTQLLIHSQFDNDGKAINSKFLTFMYNGVQDLVFGYWIQTGVDVNGEPTFSALEMELPYCTMHENFPALTSDYALNYCAENGADGDDIPLKNAFYMFFDKYIGNLYAASSKILTVDALIPLKDYVDFKLNDTIEIQGIRYVVDTMKRDLLTGITKLKLFNYDAELIPTKPLTYARSGEITFSATPTSKELTTYQSKVNPAIPAQYLWKSYNDKVPSIITQSQLNHKLATKAEGNADATSGSFTINTSITNILTIYNTINTQTKLWFNGTPTVTTAGLIYVYETGVYSFSTTVNFSTASGAQQVKFVLAVNGTNYYQNPIIAASTTAAWDIIMNCTVPLNVGDYVVLYIYGNVSITYTLNSASTIIKRI